MNTHAAPTPEILADPVAVADVSRQLLTLARRVALSDCTVLMSGESGVGKEVLAHYIHSHSLRAGRPFIAVNCAAIPEQMLEAMLFGWERGAFTGAHSAHPGKFEQAQSGTILLDEVTEMPLALQSKLLRVLQEREVERLGGERTIKLDVRVLATTNRLLRNEVQAGRFREDLYYRINVFPLQLAPLRNRREDILPLAMRVLTGQVSAGSPIPAVTASAAQRLLAHNWPGNVRELANVMQRALVLSDGTVIDSQHISFEMHPLVARAVAPADADPFPAALLPPVVTVTVPPGLGELAQTRLAAEQQVIIEALRNRVESRERIAERLGISPRTLRYKLARLRAAGIKFDAIAGSAA
jgi:two-component system response regulator FlrC